MGGLWLSKFLVLVFLVSVFLSVCMCLSLSLSLLCVCVHENQRTTLGYSSEVTMHLICVFVCVCEGQRTTLGYSLEITLYLIWFCVRQGFSIRLLMYNLIPEFSTYFESNSQLLIGGKIWDFSEIHKSRSI